MPEHSTLLLYDAPPRTDTTAPPTLLGTDNNSRNRFAVTRCIGGNRNSFDAAQIATPWLLNLTEAGASCGFPGISALKLSDKSQARANRLTIRRVIAA
jgi:hypothetical protein